MTKRRLLAIILSIVMVFSCSLPVFGETTSMPAGENEISAPVTPESEETEASAILKDSVSVVAEEEALQQQENSSNEEELDYSKWTAEDFTYGSYEKLLYGCDYTRQITVRGTALTGLSETGLLKIEKNKELVIPAKDDEGYPIVGVGESAFKNMGITSVSFPTGMMVDYDDNITNKITKRGNFIIAESAFAGNELKEVVLPEGVIAVLPYAFNNNDIVKVKLPKTIWWIETMSFANNKITTVNFPTTCDFQLEMHGMAFAKNFIKSVRLPDFTEVVNKHTFAWNTGMTPVSEEVKDSYKTYTVDGIQYDTGIVYMYADNAELEIKDRIHHAGKATASQYSDFQALVINDGTEATQNPEAPWNINDFIIEGTVVKGLSESGIAKRAVNKDLVIPDITAEGQYITEIGSASAGGYGLFASESEKFDSVYLPTELKVIGDFAFQNNGLKDVSFPYGLTTIGNVAFQTNDLTSVVLPDTVVSLGSGAFATNPKLERIGLSKGLTEIAASAFGCSDGDNYMTNLTSIELHEGITKIGSRAFAGNNFSEIVIPSTVTEIGSYAFSTKNYLNTSCKVTLNEGLKTIAADAFRNKVISEITLPTTVTKINKNTFRKEYSDNTASVVTKVFVSLKSQYEDTKNFPVSDYHKIYLTDFITWTPDDFTYGNETFELYPADETDNKITVEARVVTGFSENGSEKFAKNTKVVIPAVDSDGNKVQGVGKNAFNKAYITELTLPENVKAAYDDTKWSTTGKGMTERGDFFIGYGAFRYNNLTSLEIPEGVIHIDTYAFANNTGLETVSIPKSVMQIRSGAFYKDAVVNVLFADRNDFGLQLDAQAFSTNKIKAVQLPVNLEKLDKWTFIGNTGKEPVTNGTSAEKKGGVVYIYIAGDGGELGNYVTETSNVQKIIYGEIPDLDKPWCVDDFTFDNEGTTITGLSDAGKQKIKENPALAIPEAGPDGDAITALGDGANMTGIFVYSETSDEETKYYTPSSVTLPDTLTKIGKWTFALNASLTYENNMTSIILPDGLVEIGQTAFQNSKLTSIAIPDSVTTMGTGAFTGSGDMSSVKLSKNVADIPQSAFAAGSSTTMSLKEVVIPDGVKTIGRQAFHGAHVEELVLSDSLTNIGQEAFGNHQLTELTVPANVTEIGKYAFRISQDSFSASLTRVCLNEGLVTIGQNAFDGCGITEVDLPSTVVLSNKNKAADLIFGTAKAPANPIVKVYVSDEAKVEIYNTEYANNYSHIVVYDNLVGSGWEPEDFTYDEETSTVTGWSDNGQAKRAVLKELVIPAKTPEGKTVMGIGDAAFKIPDNEVVITKFGIDSPNGMTSVSIPNTVKAIGNEAFSQNALTTVELSNVTSVGERAFYGNDLVKVDLPDTVTALGNGAFATNDITELRLSAGVTVIPQGAFSMNIRLESIAIPDTVTEVGQTAFAGARLTSLEIPKSVTKIGEKAFHLHHLSELTIPGNVKEIGESAFEGTYKATTLKKLTLEEGVEVIGKNAFKEGLLESVVFPNSIKSVGETPFMNNTGKDGSHVVEVITENIEHINLTDSTYKIKFVGTYPLSDYEDKVKLSENEASYTGKPVEVKVTIEGLTEGVDFKVSYKDNVDIGTATITIEGIGNYSGTIDKNFVIVMTGEWKKSGSKWWYRYSDGTYPKNGWETIDGNGYYFDKSGYMAADKWVGDYYVGKSGAKAKNQWVGSYYVGDDGKYVKNQWVGNYYCGNDGKYQKGWLKLSEGWYYLGTNGKITKGWFQVKNVWYYGDAETGLLYEKEWLNGEYYLNPGGAMATGWLELDGDWYYFQNSGKVTEGWAKVNNKWYYFDGTHKMVTGLQIIESNKYFFNDNGAMLTGWQRVEGDWYYFVSSGEAAKGWLQTAGKKTTSKKDDKWYYFDGECKMVTGDYTIDGVVNEFADSGLWLGTK